jgi:hypothetical protein
LDAYDSLAAKESTPAIKADSIPNSISVNFSFVFYQTGSNSIK